MEDKQKKTQPEKKEEKEKDENKYNELYTSAVKIDKKKLISLLKCPICSGIFRTPTTINECMHTFCKSCIYKWFYDTGNPVKDICPVCEIKLGGRPLDSLIFDSSLAGLVDILFPEFEEIDKENQKKMYDAFRENKEPLPGDEEETKIHKPSIKIHLHPLECKDSQLCLPKIEQKSFLLQKNMDIETLKKFLAEKLKVQSEEINIIYKGQEMPSNYTLDDIDRLYGFDQDQTIFYYGKIVLNKN